MRVENLESIRIKLASPEDILEWSHGEVIKPETINYRTQRAEKDGLFCEKIFGPVKDYECYCGKYRRIRYKGVVCDRCGVEVTKSSVRRERMGHIKLATPCSHIWFLRGLPSRMGMILDIPMQQLERVIYFAGYIITKVNKETKKKVLEEIEKEYKIKVRKAKSEKMKKKELKVLLEDLKTARNKAREEVFSLNVLKILSEIEYHNFSLKYGELFGAGTGAEVLRKIFEKIDFKKEIQELRKRKEKAGLIEQRKILKRLKIFQQLMKAKIRPEWMFLEVIPILAPDLRPMVQLEGGRYASSDLNDLYRRVINRNNRLKYLLEINAPEVILRNEKRMLQEAVDALIDNEMRKGQTVTATTGGRRLLKSLANIVKGKQGRFRQNLLGKRVDYSGRSVIVSGPELKLSECGLPKKMALELFKPFVIKGILDRELAYNVRGASRLIEKEIDEVWAILEEVVKDKLVLLNRAPTLHRLGVQAFQVRLIEGEVIRIHPLVCRSFNADFDGDQMAVHVPLSNKSQKEAREIMFSLFNLLKPATGLPVVAPTQDIILGCYWVSQIQDGKKGQGKAFSSPGEAILAYEFGELDLKAKIKVRNLKGKSELFETSVGRIILNEALPEDYPFQNEVINSKKMEKIISEIIEKYQIKVIQETLDKVKDLGFEYSTLSGTTWGMDDLIIPPEKEGIIKETEKKEQEIHSHYQKGLLSKKERRAQVIELWHRAKSEIEELVPKTLPSTGSVFSIVDSGARGSWSQPVQMSGMKGLVINPAGETIELPVKSSFKEGFNVLEYFISTHGARKGTVDTALQTSTAGYLTRRLVDAAHEVVITREDCHDQDGITIFKKDSDDLGQDFLQKVLGRVVLEEVRSMKSEKTKKQGKVIIKKDEIINRKISEEIINKEIEKIQIRSPLSCKSIRGVCQKCYGWDLGSNQLVNIGEAVGVIASQSIGEPGTQLTMRTFHTGGVAGGGDITLGLPRVQEIFEIRTPGGKAEISKVNGKVLEITSDRVIKIKASNDDSKNHKVKKYSKTAKTGVVEYEIPSNQALWVASGQEIKKGQQLCEGSLDLKELFKWAGYEETWRYIIKEIQKIYVSQGATIHDKHFEVIMRQMFSRLKIKEERDSIFSSGEVVDRARFLEENLRLKKEKKKPAVSSPLLLGISRVALTVDSFLSAASFQETSRVLIEAAINGKEDKLRGLKENVIIGKLIPVGTGFRK